MHIQWELAIYYNVEYKVEFVRIIVLSLYIFNGYCKIGLILQSERHLKTLK